MSENVTAANWTTCVSCHVIRVLKQAQWSRYLKIVLINYYCWNRWFPRLCFHHPWRMPPTSYLGNRSQTCCPPWGLPVNRCPKLIHQEVVQDRRMVLKLTYPLTASVVQSRVIHVDIQKMNSVVIKKGLVIKLKL